LTVTFNIAIKKKKLWGKGSTFHKKERGSGGDEGRLRAWGRGKSAAIHRKKKGGLQGIGFNKGRKNAA